MTDTKDDIKRRRGRPVQDEGYPRCKLFQAKVTPDEYDALYLELERLRVARGVEMPRKREPRRKIGE